MRRVYLDNAATTWPKPESVYQAVERYLRENGAAAGRGVYREGVEADRIVGQARLAVARVLGASPKSIVFTLNCTDALNLALHGLLKSGDRVVTTQAEHNSVLRPLRYLQDQRGVMVERVRCDDTGLVDLDELSSALRQSTQLVVLTHASNVTGTIQPIREVVRIAKQQGALVLLDAAQSAGALPIDVTALGVDLLATSGHKGLLGPLGTGLLYVAPGLESQLEPLRQGGTGTISDNDIQPSSMPDRFESGNANVPGLAGLAAGAAYVLEQGVENIHAKSHRLATRLVEGLQDLPGVRVFGPSLRSERVGVVAFTVEGFDPREFASLLDASFGVQVRAGLHCAPLIHQRIGAEIGGTVRMSIGPFTTDDDIDSAIAAVREIVTV